MVSNIIVHHSERESDVDLRPGALVVAEAPEQEIWTLRVNPGEPMQTAFAAAAIGRLARFPRSRGSVTWEVHYGLSGDVARDGAKHFWGAFWTHMMGVAAAAEAGGEWATFIVPNKAVVVRETHDSAVAHHPDAKWPNVRFG